MRAGYAPVKKHSGDVAPGSSMYAYIQAWRRRNVTLEQATLFFFCSLGYMAPWTFIGSLIAFFKASRNANFYARARRRFPRGRRAPKPADPRWSSTASTTRWACQCRFCSSGTTRTGT